MPSLLLAVVVLSGGAGCAARRPPTELVDARAAYARAASGNVAHAAPDALADARLALELAERKQADDAGSDEARNLAYVAHRKALTAEARARAALAEAQEAYTLQIMTLVNRGRLADAANRLERLDEERARDGAAHPEGERRAKAALDRLTPFAAVSTAEPGTMMLRLDDSVLFEGDTADLMATARERLDRVAQALDEVKAHSIVVSGFMDPSGDARRDVEMSRRRASAVRAYLVSRGVPADRIRSEGLGSTELASSNASAEGRSANRRVEITVKGLARDGLNP